LANDTEGRWTSWSNWQAEEVEPSETRQVQRLVYYRGYKWVDSEVTEWEYREIEGTAYIWIDTDVTPRGFSPTTRSRVADVPEGGGFLTTTWLRSSQWEIFLDNGYTEHESQALYSFRDLQ